MADFGTVVTASRAIDGPVGLLDYESTAGEDFDYHPNLQRIR
jgi:hypothetical protein